MSGGDIETTDEARIDGRGRPGDPAGKRSRFQPCEIWCLTTTLPIAGSFLSGGTFGGPPDDLAPLLACGGMHFVLHRLRAGPVTAVMTKETRRRRSEADGMSGDTPSHWTDVIPVDRLESASPPSRKNVAAPPDRNAVRTIVRKCLLKHPGVVEEVIRALQPRRGTREQDRVRAALHGHAERPVCMRSMRIAAASGTVTARSS